MRLSQAFRRAIAFGALPAAALLLASGCSEDQVATAPRDSTPPASTILRIDRVGPDSIAFSWRAPGDDDLRGRADRYDLRFSTAPFDVDTWDLAERATGLGTPTAPGSLERHTLRGLSPGTTYYFSIRTADSDGNWAPASSVINLTLPAADGYPVLWRGAMLPSVGTTATGFIYRVRLRVNLGETPATTPEVVIGDAAYAMRTVPQGELGYIQYEFSTRLDPGFYDYHFTFTNGEGQTSRLPNPGSWSEPEVTAADWFQTDFVSVAPDTFLMGNAYPFSPMEERPQHEVILTNAFYLDRYEVTNAQLSAGLNWAWERDVLSVEDDTVVVAVASGARLLTAAPRRDDVLHGIRYAEETGFTPLPGREDWPATYVTWYGAALYCNIRSWWEGLEPAYDIQDWSLTAATPYAATGWRLPTEAEWEFTAQYNDSRTYPFGNDTPRAGRDGNFASAVGHPTAVGSYPEGANALGIRDLAGNVWEWCNDWKGFYSDGTIIDPEGPDWALLRVVRGGSWGSSADELLVVRRFSQRPGMARDGLGFRCARTMP